MVRSRRSTNIYLQMSVADRKGGPSWQWNGLLCFKILGFRGRRPGSVSRLPPGPEEWGADLFTTISRKQRAAVLPLYKVALNPFFEYWVRSWAHQHNKDVSCMLKVQFLTRALVFGQRKENECCCIPILISHLSSISLRRLCSLPTDRSN